MAWAFRTLIVPDEVVDTCRSLAQLLAGEGQKLWTTPLSADGAEPATHWISTGLIEEQFADLLPLSEWTQDEDDNWIEDFISRGDAMRLSILSEGAVTEVQANAIFALCDVTMQEPQQALARLGLQAVVVVNTSQFAPVPLRDRNA